jgi:hypothetical protein
MKKYLILALCLLPLALGMAAQAVPDVTPATSVLNPVTETLYVVDNDVAGATPRILIYSRTVPAAGNSWTSVGNTPIALPDGTKTYGMAVNAAGNKLYVSINNAASSKVSVYNLDTLGKPTGSPVDMTGAYWATYASPAGVAVNGNRLYVVDKYYGKIRVFNTDTNAWIKDVSAPSGTPTFFGIALTAGKIFVSNKSLDGKIFVYTYSGDTITYSTTISTGLIYPTYLKVNGDKLFAAVNGADGNDVKVYTASTNTLVGNVKSGVVGEYGWTAFDVSEDGKWLVLKKAENAGETVNRLCKIKVADITLSSTATFHANTGRADGIVISHDRHVSALTDSQDGSVEIINNLITEAASTVDYSSMHQYKLDGTTEIAKGASTNERKIVVKFSASNTDSDNYIPIVEYHVIGTSAYSREIGVSTASGAPVTMTVPSASDLTNNNYEWRVVCQTPWGNEGGPFPYNSATDTGTTDFVINGPVPDTISPDAVSNLTANPGSSAGQVNLTWTAPGDDHMTGTVSGYQVRYATANAPFANPFTNANFASTGTAYTTSGWSGFVAGGATESRILSGLPYSATLPTYVWIAIKAYDEVPNIGPLGAQSTAETLVNNGGAAPTVTRVYPSRAPRTSATPIIIEGTNFTGGGALAHIRTSPATTLSGVSIISPTRIAATVPASLIASTYHITVTTGGGTSVQTAADTFEVTSGGESPIVRSMIKNFNAGDGENAQSTLTWTNPGDIDMATLEVRRYTGSYPASYSSTSGTVVYAEGPVEPSAARNYVNTGLVNGTTYYYVAFIKDTSGNWSTVDYTAPDVNANTGIVGTTGPAPTVTGIVPNNGNQGISVPVTITGTNFVSGATVKLTRGADTINATGVTVAGATSITGTIPIPLAAAIGQWNVVVTNPDLQAGTLTNGFTVNAMGPAPTVTSIDPNNGFQGQTVSVINLIGTNFATGATVKLTNGADTINATGVTVASATHISCTIPIPGTATVGQWNVVVTNTDTQSGSLTNGFTVFAPGTAPTVTAIAPISGKQGDTVNATVTGTNFVTGATVKLAKTSQPDITGASVVVVSPTSITASFAIPAGAQLGLWTVMVTNPDTQTGSLVDGFTVEASGTTTAEVPRNLVLNKSLNDAILTWDAPLSGEPGGGYRVYRGTSPTSITIQIGADIPAGTHTLTDTGAVSTADSYYYVVKAFSGPTESGPSNMVFLNKTSLVPAVSNIFWVSVPYRNSYTTAQSIANDINGANTPGSTGTCVEIGRWDTATGTYQSLSYLEGLGWMGTDFSVVTGESYYVAVVGTTAWAATYANEPAFSFNLTYPNGTNIYWVSLPYSGDYTDAQSIVNDINTASPGAAVEIGRFTSGGVYESLSYLEGLGWMGTNFTFTPGEGYYVSLGGSVTSWTPKVK